MLDIYIFNNANPGSIAVMLILLILSIVSIYMIIKNYLFFKSLQIQSDDFNKLSDEPIDAIAELYFDHKFNCIEYRVFNEGVQSMRNIKCAPYMLSSIVESKMHKLIDKEINALESMISPLNILASIAPFIGLFGTVLGVIGSLSSLSGGAEMYIVLSSMSEALIATLLGLAVAIPAHISYSIFDNKIRDSQHVLNSLVGNFITKYIYNVNLNNV